MSDFHDNDAATTSCEPCAVEGNILPADRFCPQCQEYLCDKCSTHHLSQKATRSHALVALDEIKTATNEVKTTPARTQGDKCSQQCSEHQNKTIEYFCEDHACICCSSCIISDHRHCGDPINIKTLAADIRNLDEFKTFDEKLKAVGAAYTASKDDIDALLKQLIEDDANLKVTFKRFRKRVNDMIDKLETDMTAKAKQIRHAEEEKLIALSKTLEKSLGDVEALTKKIEHLLESGRNCDVFLAMKTKESQLVRLNDELRHLTRGKTCQRYVFRPNNDMLKVDKLGLYLNVRTEDTFSRSYTVPALNQQSNQFAVTETVPRGAESRVRRFSPAPTRRSNGQDWPDRRGQTIPAPPTTHLQDIDWRAMAASMKIGARVRRGRNLVRRDWLGKDGGGLGTVVGQESTTGSWLVRWDAGGGGGYYRMGGERGGVFELLIVDPAPDTPTHIGTRFVDHRATETVDDSNGKVRSSNV